MTSAAEGIILVFISDCSTMNRIISYRDGKDGVQFFSFFLNMSSELKILLTRILRRMGRVGIVANEIRAAWNEEVAFNRGRKRSAAGLTF